MSKIAADQVQMLVAAPVVSTESTSPEAILARNAKRLQVQAEADSKYDTVLESFRCQSQSINPSLLISVGTIGLLFVGSILLRKRTIR